MRQILIETSIFKTSPQQISEALANPNAEMFVEGILATSEVKNGNGRYYPHSIWEREINKYMEGPIAEHRALGELDHPDSAIINLKNVSHNIVKCWWDGNKILGRIKILPTPSGNILKELLRNNISVGVSSRGMGSLKPMSEGTLEVQDDFDLVGWDFVSTPSNPGSWMKEVKSINEGLNNYQHIINPYDKVQSLVTDILCSNGNCPIF